MRVVTCLTAVAVLALAACNKPATPPIATEPLPPAATQPSPLDPIACKSADLALKHLSDDAGAGQRQVVYTLTNTGTTACTLRGFVTATWFGADGKPLDGVNVQQYQGSETPGEITVAPAGSAVFDISFTGIQATDKLCVNSATLTVIPPANTQAIQIEDEISPCTDHISMNPIRALRPDDAQQ